MCVPRSDWCAPTWGDRAPGLLSGSVALGAPGGGPDQTLEAKPGRAAGQARGSDAEQPVPARGCRGLSVSRYDPYGVVSSQDPGVPAAPVLLPQTWCPAPSDPGLQAPTSLHFQTRSPGPQPPPPSDSGVQTSTSLLPQTQDPRPPAATSFRPRSLDASDPGIQAPSPLLLQFQESKTPGPLPSDLRVQALSTFGTQASRTRISNPQPFPPTQITPCFPRMFFRWYFQGS